MVSKYKYKLVFAFRNLSGFEEAKYYRNDQSEPFRFFWRFFRNSFSGSAEITSVIFLSFASKISRSLCAQKLFTFIIFVAIHTFAEEQSLVLCHFLKDQATGLFFSQYIPEPSQNLSCAPPSKISHFTDSKCYLDCMFVSKVDRKSRHDTP